MIPAFLLVAWAGAWACTLVAGRLAAARRLPESFDIEMEWWRVTVSSSRDAGLASGLTARQKRMLQRWFSAGTAAGLAAGAASVALLVGELVALLPALLTPEQAAAAAAKQQAVPRLQLALPGVTLPASHALPLWLALAASLVVHEAGHAVAAAAEGVGVHGAGLSLVLLVPAAFVRLDDADLAALGRHGMLRVAAAGAWHNLALCLACWAALRVLPALRTLQLLLGYTASLSAALALLNMAPVHGLDGQQALRALLLRPRRPAKELPEQARQSGDGTGHSSNGSSAAPHRRERAVRWTLHAGTALYAAVLLLHLLRAR